MGQTTEIAWTDHTLNPWIGCTRVSEGCKFCYAEAQDKHRRWTPDGWGKGKPRKRTSAATWNQPIKWNRDAVKAGVRRRVFCASLADVFDEEVPEDWRYDLFRLIAKTPALDWQLLTKRPESMLQRLSDRDWWCRAIPHAPATAPDGKFYDPCLDRTLRNVWIGTTVENQAAADLRVPILLQVPAAVRFLSVEPQLGPVELMEYFLVPKDQDEMYKVYPDCGRALGGKLHWIINGGESGGKRRPFEVEWAQKLHDDCKAAGVPFFMKQDSGLHPGKQGRLPDALYNCKEFPELAPVQETLTL